MNTRSITKEAIDENIQNLRKKKKVLTLLFISGIAVIAASSGSISESKQTNILYCTGKLSCKREGGNGETELPLLSSNPTSNMRDASIRQWLLEQTLWIISSLKKNVVTVASRF